MLSVATSFILSSRLDDERERGWRCFPRNDSNGAAMSGTFFPYVSRRRFDRSEGVNDAYTIRLQAIGKDNKENQYLIANEWIAAQIGRLLGLPIPPCALMGTRPNQMFASISFDGRKKLRWCNPAMLWQFQPALCSGILAFDMLIANCDRHARNIKVDNPARPKVVRVFDHDRAMFYIAPGEGAQRLDGLLSRLGISGGPVSGGHRHCLIDEITRCDFLFDWIQKISAIPKFFIEETCQAIRRIGGVTKREVEKATDFLLYRRDNLSEIVGRNKEQFRSIDSSAWPMVLP
jgi:hypothetical protein